jgi:hypothetical protein
VQSSISINEGWDICSTFPVNVTEILKIIDLVIWVNDVLVVSLKFIVNELLVLVDALSENFLISSWVVVESAFHMVIGIFFV